MAQPKFLERGHEIVARQNSLLRRQNNLRANPCRLLLAEFHLTLKLSGGGKAKPKNVSEHAGAEAQHNHQHHRKTTIHSFPLPLATTLDLLRFASKRAKAHLQAMHCRPTRTLFIKPHLQSNANPIPASNRLPSRSSNLLMKSSSF